MSGGQEKNFSILGPKLSESKAQQNYGDKTLQTRVQEIDYLSSAFKEWILSVSLTWNGMHTEEVRVK